MPRSIFLLNDFGHINGGTAQVAIDDAVALAQAGHAVTYFCAVGPVDPALAAAGVRTICLEQQEIADDPDRLGAARRGLWNGVAARALDRLLADCPEPPLVHIHGWTKALSGSVCAVALKRRAPVVVTLHDFFTACPNGGFYQYPQQRICELTAMSPSCIACNCDIRSYGQKLYRVARQAVQERAGRLPDGVHHFIHHSQLVRDVLAPYLPRNAVFHAVPVAIEPPAGGPVPAADNRDVVMVGRLSPEKGPLLFAQAAVRAGIRPIFVGDGREREAVLAAAPDAEITGWQSRAGVAARLGQARALVFPSLLYETFGLAVAEALGRGLPVIVGDRTAAAELVDDGENGLLFRTGDAASLASRLEILKDSTRVAAMGRCAYARYQANPLSQTHHLESLLAVYRAAGAGA